MSKTKEELDALKEEVEVVNGKLAELTPEEIAQVNGGEAITCGTHCGVYSGKTGLMTHSPQPGRIGG